MTNFTELQAETAAEVHHRLNDEGRCLSVYRGDTTFRRTAINRDGVVRVQVGRTWRSAHVSPYGLRDLVVHTAEQARSYR